VRIAWFTPFSTRSAIGEFSAHVTRVLARHAEVEIWTSDEPPYWDTELRVIGFSQESKELALLEQREAVVYNMGDYLPFHRQIHAVAQRYPGVVILHDRVLHHLFAGMWLMEPEPSPQTYVARMASFYGEAGGEIARASLEGLRRPVWESDEEVLRFPLFEEAIALARGVVTHSARQAEDVRRRWAGPVSALHLPCYGEVLGGLADRGEGGGGPGRAADGRLRLLTVGHLNPNKQVHRVVAMLAADPVLAERVRYTVVGPDDGFADYAKEVREAIECQDGRLQVDVLGWRPQEELDRLMAEADVFVNLRHPVMEGGSASLMRELAYGRPVLCFASGFFGELPEGSVMRVPPGDFGAAREALGRLVTDAELRRRLGASARALAASYDEQSYVEGLLELIEWSRRAAPALTCLDAAARELGFMKVDARLPIYDEIASDFARIFGI
jgi:glycosyltransferase involved in cell wall biosynthesis